MGRLMRSVVTFLMLPATEATRARRRPFDGQGEPDDAATGFASVIWVFAFLLVGWGLSNIIG